MIRSAFSLVLALSLSSAALAQEAPAPDSLALALALAETDPAAARAMIERAAEGGSADDLYSLAVLIGLGIGGEADRGRARTLQEQAAAQGSNAAKLSLASSYLSDEDTSNDARALEYIQQAVESDPRFEGPSKFLLGRAYIFGAGVEQDLDRAMTLLEAADAYEATLGTPSGYAGSVWYLLARGYQSGWGGRNDKRRAASYFRKSAEAGVPAAMWYYGMALIQGEGVGVDEREAYRWVRRAAEDGYVEALISTAVMLATAQGVAENDAEARQWYATAAATGSAHALRGLGGMLLTGEGGQPDIVRGFAYIELAAEAGDAGAAQLLRELGPAPPQLADQIDRARQDWLREFPQPR